MDPKIGSLNDQSESSLTAIQKYSYMNTNTASANASSGVPALLAASDKAAHTRPDQISSPYSVERYNTLPTFEEAEQIFIERNGLELINNKIAPLIANHNLKSKIAVELLCRSFALRPGEKLVHFNHTATPWTAQAQSELFHLRVREEAWLLTDGRWMPYEFAYDRPSCQTIDGLAEDDTIRHFLSEFAALLTAGGLENVLALRAAPEHPFEGFVEVTQGRVILYFRPSDVSIPP